MLQEDTAYETHVSYMAVHIQRQSEIKALEEWLAELRILNISKRTQSATYLRAAPEGASRRRSIDWRWRPACRARRRSTAAAPAADARADADAPRR